jgi:hypothetical protein
MVSFSRRKFKCTLNGRSLCAQLGFDDVIGFNRNFIRFVVVGF